MLTVSLVVVMLLLGVAQAGAADPPGASKVRPASPGGVAALKPGELALAIPQGARRTTDAQGNATIDLPDGRKVRVLKNRGLEVLGPGGQVLHRGTFERWGAEAGKRRAGARASQPRGELGARAGKRAFEARAARIGHAEMLLIYK